MLKRQSLVMAMSVFWFGLGALLPGCSSRPPSMSTAEAVEQDIRPHKRRMRVCYEDLLNAGTAPKQFKMLLYFYINGIGEIQRFRVVEATPPHEGLKKCLVEEFKKIRFNDPRSFSREVNYPLTYSYGP